MYESFREIKKNYEMLKDKNSKFFNAYDISEACCMIFLDITMA
jgi:hypothetical protein